MSDAAPQEPLVKNLKRAGEQVLGAKPLTGNDHVRLSALLKVAALEIEALCAARDDAAELRAVLRKVHRRLEIIFTAWDRGFDRAYVMGCARAGSDEIRAALAATEGSE